MKRRLTVMAAVVLAWSCVIEARLVYLQVFERADLAERAQDQHDQTIPANAKRGDILDRNGNLLAFSVDAESVYGVPSALLDAGKDPAQVVGALCDALGDCSADERKRLVARFSKRSSFAYVRRLISPDQVKHVALLDLDGIGFMKENRRYYPNRNLAAHVLGYTGLDNIGLAGLESKYDNLIKGKPGKIRVQTDAKGRAFGRIEQPPTAGATLELTIDQYLQHVAETELQAGVKLAGADGGSVVVLDPASGEILAMANYPTFNPNVYNQFDEKNRRNRAVQDLYEPGSTFKIVTAGAALQEQLFTPETPIDTSPGFIRFGSRIIDEDKSHNYGLQTLKGVIVHSSNVGAIKIGLKVGAERMSDYVQRFGFGRPASPDFRGESPGIVWSASRLTDSALASVSMGYQIAVTPLQMAAAASVVANGGELVVPRIVRAVIRGRNRLPVPRTVVGRPISTGVAAQLTDIMEAVVTDGTGKLSQVPGYTDAGKTGTAQKVVNRRYSHTDYNVSFVGFVPSRNPVFTIVVVVDTPRKVPPYGGSVSAPIFQRVAAAALRHHGVPPNINPQPPILVERNNDAHEQTISTIGVQTPVITVATGADEYPDLTGMSARDALRMLAKLGVSTRLIGAGLVVEQDPPAGTPLDSVGVATLRLQRRPPVTLTSAAGE
jgi:cell division protein FtsI (penicillin-binding protein 3)